MKKLIFILPVLIACASPQTPTGGDKDTIAPILAIDSNQFTINSFPKKIKLLFNENIVVNKNEIKLNPIIYPNPEIKITNQEIDIKIDPQSLAANTTYTLTLNNAIKDLNEGNLGTYKPLLFSTGNKMDTNQINYNCFNQINEDKKIIANTSINTYQYNFKSCCFTSLNIPLQGTEKTEIFIDQNKNNLFDSTEKGNVIENLKANNNIYLINPLKTIICHPYSGGLAAIGLPHIYNFMTNFASNKDTLFITDLKKCPITIQKQLKIKDSIKTNSQFTEIQLDTNSKSLIFNYNIKALNYDSIRIITPSDTLLNSTKFITIANNKINITNLKSNYKIQFLTNAIQYQNNVFNSKTILIKNEQNFNYIEMKNNTSKTQSILCFENEKTHQITEIPANSSKLIYLPIGKITVLAYSDTDNNGILNHPVQFKTAEKIYLLINTECLKNMINTIEINE